jgi:hypothetical protein
MSSALEDILKLEDWIINRVPIIELYPTLLLNEGC